MSLLCYAAVPAVTHCCSGAGALTGAVGQRAHERRQHFHCCRGVGVSAQALHHLGLEPSHHIQQDIVRQAQLVQVPVNLQRWKVLLRARHAPWCSAAVACSFRFQPQHLISLDCQCKQASSHHQNMQSSKNTLF